MIHRAKTIQDGKWITGKQIFVLYAVVNFSMNKITRVIKTNIKKDFQNARINVRYVSATDYTVSSDKIKIRTNIPYEIILTYLIQHTRGVAIFPKGTIVSKRGNFGSCVFEEESDIEFIEIETIEEGNNNESR